MEASFWNIGIKVDDIGQEIGFLQNIGARLLLRETLPGPAGQVEYAFVDLAGTRIFLTREPIYEDKLNYKLLTGLTHAVFEVQDLDSEFERIKGLGTEVLIEPTEMSAGFGSRRVSFFRSPNGLIFEVMQIHESKI